MTRNVDLAFKFIPGNVFYEFPKQTPDNLLEPPSKTLVRRGSRLTQSSMSWGLELAVPVGIMGLLLMNLRKRRRINDKQLDLIIKIPTYMAAFGTCLGIGIYTTGKFFEHFNRVR